MADYPLSIVVPEDAACLASILQVAVLGESGNDREFRIRRKDDSICWFAVSWQPLWDGDKRIGVRMSMRDIRERKALEEERARHSQELETLAEARAASIIALKKKKIRTEKLAALGGMAAKVAHEINNPIAGIKNAIRLVRDDVGLDPASSRMLKLVDGEIDRIGNLLRQMYQLYKPTVTEASEFDLVTAIEDVVTMVNAQYEAQQIAVIRKNWPTAYQARLCEQEFRQIVHNLLQNAWEASPDAGNVEIEFHQSDCSRLRVSIRDFGSGIEPEVASRIFEPFVTTKLDSGRSGSGLGLAISQCLANAMGGSIELETHGEEGTVFLVDLPVEQN